MEDHRPPLTQPEQSSPSLDPLVIALVAAIRSIERIPEALIQQVDPEPLEAAA